MRGRILIIDDEVSSRDSVVIYLKSERFVVHIANTIREGRQLVSENAPYDLIICDGSIQTIGDGAELALELQKAGHKVLLISGDDWSSVVGKMPHLHKPVSVEELQEALDRYASRQQTE